MKNYEIEEYLTPLLSKPITFQGKEKGKLIRWVISDKTLKLVTDQADVVILQNDLNEMLPTVKVVATVAIVHSTAEKSIIGQSGIELKNILLNNIRKVQDDPTYLPQAQEVNANVKTLIDLAKTEVEMIKAVTMLSKS